MSQNHKKRNFKKNRNFNKEENNELPNFKIKISEPTQSNRNNTKGRMLVKLDTEEEKQLKNKECFEVITPLHKEVLEVTYEAIHIGDTLIEMPKRPSWNYTDSKGQLEAREKEYLKEYFDEMEKNYQNLGYYELNIEIWRQLWRVIERSDVLLLILDMRFPIQTFNPSLYNYVTKELKKHMIVVFNKIDLVPASVVIAWKEYFLEKFPELFIVILASRPGSFKSRVKKNIKMATEGAQQIYEICQKLMQDKMDISSWKEKIEVDSSSQRTQYEIEIKDKDEEIKILTLGLIGAPNVGKSTLINALKGKTVVSARNRPGVTKHFQTIYITHNVVLCDCPGLLFPSLVSKSLQVIMGSYGIANVKVPMHPIIFLAERYDLPTILGLKKFDLPLTAHNICQAWAIKQGFNTAKNSRPDVNRAANHLLRKCLEGNLIPVYFYPPNFIEHKQTWFQHPDIEEIKALQLPKE